MIEKVLIVDDSIFMRMVLKKILKDGYDFEFTEAKDGLEALKKFKTFHPDLIFLDLTMPVMDGFQALDEIKKLDPNALVIVVTADVQEKVQVRVMEAGALMVLPKPPTKESVEAAVLKAMEVKIEV